MSAIGEISAASGVHIETIQYFERIGLMPKPARAANGRRRYDVHAAHQLAFIRRSRALGFSIAEIRALIGLSNGRGRCADVHSLTAKHLGEVRRKIADLKKMERTLAKAAQRCARDASPRCPIIEALAAPSVAP
jgi:MerR family mercuric resistance operon transcriptional regulator